MTSMDGHVSMPSTPTPMPESSLSLTWTVWVWRRKLAPVRAFGALLATAASEAGLGVACGGVFAAGASWGRFLAVAATGCSPAGRADWACAEPDRTRDRPNAAN